MLKKISEGIVSLRQQVDRMEQYPDALDLTMETKRLLRSIALSQKELRRKLAEEKRKKRTELEILRELERSVRRWQKDEESSDVSVRQQLKWVKLMDELDKKRKGKPCRAKSRRRSSPF